MQNALESTLWGGGVCCVCGCVCGGGGAMKRQRLNKERTKEKKKKKFKEKETQPRLEMNHVTRASRSSRLLFPLSRKAGPRGYAASPWLKLTKSCLISVITFEWSFLSRDKKSSPCTSCRGMFCE